MGTVVLGASIETARIPELSPLTVDLPLALGDQIPIYIAAENKTKKVPLSVLNTFFDTGGGGGSHPPVVFGGEVIYIVPLIADNTITASIPSLAGKDFTLERSGIPLIALLPDGSNGPAGTNTAEYEILDAGGFKLLQSGDVLHVNERFKLTIFSLIGSSSTSVTTSFIAGKKVVSSNTTLDPITEVNKLIQIRASATAITLIIPSVDDMAANSFIPIESSINNTKPCTIQTTGGQLIYFNSGSKTSIYLMPGEVCWLFRDNDGLYVINDFADRYRNIAKPIAAYKAELNQLVCNGQAVLRADWPRLWEYVQSLGASLVSDATWNTVSVTLAGRTIDKPYRGCFSQGDGSTTFRIPDLMNMALRGVKTESGTDAERHLNKPGGYQDDVVGPFTADITVPKGHSYSGGPNVARFSNGSSSPENIEVTGVAIDTNMIETRPENIGVLWVING